MSWKVSQKGSGQVKNIGRPNNQPHFVGGAMLEQTMQFSSYKELLGQILICRDLTARHCLQIRQIARGYSTLA